MSFSAAASDDWPTGDGAEDEEEVEEPLDGAEDIGEGIVADAEAASAATAEDSVTSASKSTED